MGGLPRPTTKLTSMADTQTIERPDTSTLHDTPWNVLVHDDPVNLMGYVTLVLMRIFGYPEGQATEMMLCVHRRGRAVVWSGERERAEHYAHQLQAHQLKASIEKTS